MEINKKQPEKKTSSLGRGLSSLLSAAATQESLQEGFAFIAIEKIKSNPFQPRNTIPLSSIMDLSESIKEKGVIQPITVVRSKTEPDQYILVAGERRLQAAKLAGYTEVPSLIKELTEQDMAELAIIENIHRKQLNPIEEGYAFLRLNSEFKLTQDQIAAKISKNKSYVDNKMRLTRLPQLIQNTIATGEISENHGRVLQGLNDEQAMIAALKIVIRNNLSVQRTEELVREIKSESNNGKKTLRPHPTMEWEQKYGYIKQDLVDGFGVSVKLRKNRKDGSALVINFNNDEELVSFYRKITGKR